jgi:hypothetical protein
VSLKLPKYEAAVCKVLFQLTKASRNDDAFFDAGAVQPMLALLEAQSGQLSKTTQQQQLQGMSPRGQQQSQTNINNNNNNGVVIVVPVEAPVFLAGALKNISATETAQQRLGQLGAVSVLCTLMRGASELVLVDNEDDDGGDDGGGCKPELSSGGGGGPSSGGGGGRREERLIGVSDKKQQVQLLTHVTGALRNLSLSKAHHRQVGVLLLAWLFTCVLPISPTSPTRTTTTNSRF